MNAKEAKIKEIEATLQKIYKINIFCGSVNTQSNGTIYSELDKITAEHGSLSIGNLWTKVPSEHTASFLNDAFVHNRNYISHGDIDENTCSKYARIVDEFFESEYEIYSDQFSVTGDWKIDTYGPFVAISDCGISSGIILINDHQYVFIRRTGN